MRDNTANSLASELDGRRRAAYIEAALLPVLRQQHIVYGTHFEESRHDPGIRIVLECIPLRSVLEQIETALRRIIAPIPAKPTPVQTVTTEPPRIVTPQEAL